ncbi:37 kDa salivary gland allergen Aed a 2-like [Anopheles bellator]|uniref:37 kDa salivary gland allergen Aed a 2-like n=1 Tax=Anopheles bellator TaxID=139047 RepID=UPI0026489B08|nr:37 kDa salivary gland allergen Aed a 2-like [Anopheles bellator]
MIALVLAVSLIGSFTLVASQASAAGDWKPLEPEETLFVYTRCQEDHLPAGAKRTQYHSQWRQWKLLPDDPVTHCYLKCALVGLGLWDERAKRFQPARITTQHLEYKKLNEASDSEVAQYKAAVGNLKGGKGSCTELYKAYKPVHDKFVALTQKLYHGTPQAANKVYQANPFMKRKDESAMAYCEKMVYSPKTKKDMCAGRQYQLTGSKELRDVIECIFRELRYTKNGELNVDEIVRDFKLINKGNLEQQIRSVLSKCRGMTPYDHYTCLLKSNLKKDFKKAFDFREIRSANYSYLLKGNKYDRAKVKSMIAEIDKKTCG